MNEHNPPIQLVGAATDSIGLGAGFRYMINAFRACGCDFTIYDLSGGKKSDFFDESVPFVKWLKPGLTIYFINGDLIEKTGTRLGGYDPDSYNIIHPAWELERYPKEWADLIRENFNEVWTNSRFLNGILREALPQMPVIHLPHNCEVKNCGLLSRRDFGIREDMYTFLFMFDFLSWLERKNPLAIVEAFKKMLARDPWLPAQLVIKTQNAKRRPQMLAEFKALLDDIRDNAVWLDSKMTPAEVNALINVSDCFVSLHRSEGFGLSMLEAMSLGKPVIATAWSGNMDYCTDKNSFLVPYRMIPLKPGEYAHWQNQVWADPDVEYAAWIMENLVRHPEEGNKKGAIARRDAILEYSDIARGLAYMDRIEKIAAKPPAGI